ncbi:MAG: SDR family oxidoreductase [Gammaproteobacteria bacterium]|nr:SDR family oxidoreductase [Gammaproteobacteria bacterium]
MIDINFQNGCVLIVGGSGGIGSLCAKQFADEGAKVAITYFKNEKAANDVASGINSDVEVYQLDNKDPVSVQSAMDDIAKKYGGINTIVNAAGFDIPQKFITDIDIDLWKSVMDADINGFFNLIKSGLPYLRESKGSIVFISSAGLFKYPPGDVLSVAPKATIEHVLKGIAKEEGSNGVRANSIALGIIETGIFHRLREENNTFFDDAWHEAVMNTLALKRFGNPEEVANTAVFLASSKAGYITGHCIPVDGGYHI